MRRIFGWIERYRRKEERSAAPNGCNMRRLGVVLTALLLLLGAAPGAARATETLAFDIVAVHGPFEAGPDCVPATVCYTDSWRGRVTEGDLEGASLRAHWFFRGPIDNDQYFVDGPFEIDAGGGDILRGYIGFGYVRVRDWALVVDYVDFADGEGRFAGLTGSGKLYGTAAPATAAEDGTLYLASRPPQVLDARFTVSLD